MTEFYDANSPLGDSVLEDKSSVDIENDILLCDSCKNVILKPCKDQLICPACLRIYDPHHEIIQVQDSETTIDEIGSRGEMTFKDDGKDKPIRKTLNHSSVDIEDNLDYVKKEFDRYKQTEIIDKDTITALNKTRNRRPNNNE
ncbi:MAG: hypothetical protein L0H53_00570 [Candidatus Nitrosocosmicus sp.]|nr:hypothetical protein [Candidatus Nitrosocosmicus sp.]MDN5866030.1 hypothetical protein [Candidatus Nitrosocosmicus sp.]